LFDVTNHHFKRVPDHELFITMAMYLLFSATYHQVPLASVIDMKIKESLEKSGSAKNISLWNWTPIQKSLLEADLSRVILTSSWSTGKARILFEVALKLARDGKFVIFVLHYSQLSIEKKSTEERSSSVQSSVQGEAEVAAKLLNSPTETETTPTRQGFGKFLRTVSFKQDSEKGTKEVIREIRGTRERLDASKNEDEFTKGLNSCFSVITNLTTELVFILNSMEKMDKIRLILSGWLNHFKGN
jgi:hypothetical protein